MSASQPATPFLNAESTEAFPSPPLPTSSSTKRNLDDAMFSPSSLAYRQLNRRSKDWLRRYEAAQGITIVPTGDVNDDLCLENSQLKAAYEFRLAEHKKHCDLIAALEEDLEKERDRREDLEMRVKDLTRVLDMVRALGSMLSTPSLLVHNPHYMQERLDKLTVALKKDLDSE
ncbi:hypothetical protein BDP27DRAFT_1357706 [Rhodocollybia butyracea]|uniref:Uncharacterized protein n=1 Tax=Rhodocollybia butyracea TaxID=206335 RepID=A0A9P5Q240_9AGAR|nr:hypothetical protein BDP27DRAFT_1357706 [Rhodocollybia butyracea]